MLSLKHLDLRKNKIRKIKCDECRGFENLEILDLSQNELVIIEMNMFQNVEKLQVKYD